MKGIILAGGHATRLFPSTITTSKQMLPVYDRPMIFYPLNTLIKGGIKDILIITHPDHINQFKDLLGDMFEKQNVKISFKVQPIANGLPGAFILGEEFVGQDGVALILGDNIFEDDFSESIKSFKSGGNIFATKVSDPERFGVVKFDETGKAVKIVEKPKEWISDYAITGLYLFDNRAIEFAKNLKPSARGELEITDIQKKYLESNELQVTKFNGAWFDAGTHDSLLEASIAVKQKKIYKTFDPIIDQALQEDCTKRKEMVKKS